LPQSTRVTVTVTDGQTDGKDIRTELRLPRAR